MSEEKQSRSEKIIMILIYAFISIELFVMCYIMGSVYVHFIEPYQFPKRMIMGAVSLFLFLALGSSIRK